MKKLMRILLIASLVLVSCHKTKNSPSVENRIEKATLLIDQGDYDSAIEILEEAITNQDDTPKLRLVLSSAYAGRAGIKVENYWDYLVGYDVFVKSDTSEVTTELIPENRIPDTLNDDNKKQILMLNGYYKDFQKLEKKTAKIPSLQKKNQYDLYRARTIIQKDSSPSSRLYRSMLTAVVAKSEITEGSQVLKTWAESQFRLCQNTMPDFSPWLIRVLDLISDGLNDLGQAYPDENANYQSVRKEISNGIQLTGKLQPQTKNLEDVCQLKK